MTDTIFLNVAFGDYRYIEQQERCNASIRAVYPDANIKSWTNEYPEGSRTHRESLYGFKVHAVKWAMQQGYKKIIWMDCACILQKEVDYWFCLNEKYAVVAAKDDNLLKNHISDKYVAKYLDCISAETWSNWHLVGGSLYVFDFSLEKCHEIFEGWWADEMTGYFGSQHEQATRQINKHRHDESSMAVNLYANESEPVPYDICRYNNGPGSIVTKLHFK